MSTDINIFVDSNESVEEFGKQVEHLLGLKLERDVAKVHLDPRRYLYSYSDPERQYWFGIIQLPRYYLVNDDDMLFETYTYQLQTTAFSLNPDEKWERSKQLAQTIFDRFKSTGRYRLLMTKNLDLKLDQYDPPDSVKEDI